MGKELTVIQPKEKKIRFISQGRGKLEGELKFLDPALHHKADQIRGLDRWCSVLQMAYLPLALVFMLTCTGLLFFHDYVALTPVFGSLKAAWSVFCPLPALFACVSSGMNFMAYWRDRGLAAAGLPKLLEAEKRFEETNPVCLAEQREALVLKEQFILAELAKCREERAPLDAKLGLPPFRG